MKPRLCVVEESFSFVPFFPLLIFKLKELQVLSENAHIYLFIGENRLTDSLTRDKLNGSNFCATALTLFGSNLIF